MCAINPKQQMHFALSVYTSLDMTKDEFMSLVLDKAMRTEANLNSDARLRWHVKENMED